MPRLEMDAEKLKIEGENLKTIARDYNNLLNSMFDKINKIQNTAWSGDSADSGAARFVQKALSDKANMQSLAVSMNSLANTIISYANSVNNSSDNNI